MLPSPSKTALAILVTATLAMPLRPVQAQFAVPARQRPVLLLPDLVVDMFFLSWLRGHRGTSEGMIEVLVRNVGRGLAGPSLLHFGSNTARFSTPTPDLRGGASAWVTFRLHGATGPCELSVDGSGQIFESNEQNNSRYIVVNPPTTYAIDDDPNRP